MLSREAKKRLEAAELFGRGGNQPMADKERREAEVIKAYLPEQLSEADVADLVEQTIKQTGASGAQDMGKVIGTVKAKAGNRADGGVIAKIVKAKLQ